MFRDNPPVVHTIRYKTGLFMVHVHILKLGHKTPPNAKWVSKYALIVLNKKSNRICACIFPAYGLSIPKTGDIMQY